MTEDKDTITIFVNGREKVVSSNELSSMANSPSIRW